MKFKFCAWSFLLSILLIACDTNREEANTENTVEKTNADSSPKMNNDPAIDTDSIVNVLQGKWKETEYPYRLAHFENTTVKFVEEGVAEEPTFKEYTISNHCPFEVNNIKNAGAKELFLIMPGAKTCEILKLSGDTLLLNGFNVSTNSDYNIIYKKLE
jgi:hypothetical protein